MSEQNNNCETCGNNKEPDGLCFDCDHQRECGICYENKRWGCDGGDFVEGMNCDHKVCEDCSVKIDRCPFCRRPWREEETEDEEEEEQEETLTVEELRQSINTLSVTYFRLTERQETETDMEQIEATNRILIDTLELLLGYHNRIERLMGIVAPAETDLFAELMARPPRTIPDDAVLIGMTGDLPETDLFAELMETGDVADTSQDGVNYQVRIYYRDGDMDFLPNSDSDSGSNPDYSTLELVNYNYFQFIEWIETDAVYQGRAVIRVELTSTTATDEEEYPAPEVLDTLDLTSHWTTEE